MANACYTRVEIGGDTKDVKELVSFVRSKRSKFDFECIVPQPFD